MLELNFSDSVAKWLVSQNLRRINNAEIVLLAKVLSDEMPLLDPEVDARKYLMENSALIEHALYALNEYVYILEQDRASIKDTLLGFIKWRSAVAYGQAFIIFSSDDNRSIDELSALPTYIDASKLCALNSNAKNNAYTYNILKKFVQELKSKTAA